MAQFRVLNTALNPKHRIQHALTKIYGIGKHQSHKIVAQLGVHPDMKVEDLYNDMDKVRNLVDSQYETKVNLNKQIGENIRDKIDIGCYQGQRHLFGLPVHGQRTKSNAKSNRRMTIQRMRSMGVPMFKEKKVVRRFNKRGD